MLITRFSFGRTYSIELKSGVTIDVARSEDILGIIATELAAAETYQMNINTDPKRTVLLVTPVNQMGKIWNQSIPQLIDDLRMALAEYNMTDEWPKHIPRALSAIETLGVR